MNGLTLTLPWPPSVNHYWMQDRKRGRTYIGKKGVAYRSEAGWLARIARAGREPFACEISVALDVYPPDKRRRDIDNILKAMLDAMQHAGVYEDDYLVTELMVSRRGVVPGGRVIARIKPIEGGDRD